MGSSNEASAGEHPLARLATHRLLVYGLGLGVVLAARVAPAARPVRLALVALALCVMALTYVGERLPASGGVARPGSLVVGLAGIGVGTVLVGTVGLAGLVVVLGGLLFVHRASHPGEQP